MKQITAVECKQCHRLIDSSKEFLQVETMRLTKMNARGAGAHATVWYTKEGESFCDSGCLYEFIKKEEREEEIPF